MTRGRAAIGLAASVAAIVAATTLPWSGFQGHSHWTAVRWIPFADVPPPHDVAQNLLLFAPFGAFAAALAPRRRPAATALGVGLAALLLSGAAELFQSFGHGRIASATDVVLNVAGAMLGALIVARRNSVASLQGSGRGS